MTGRTGRAWPAAVGLLLFAFYVRGVLPTIASGDSAELATAAVTLGVAHSPGYPLYVLAGKAFSLLVPFGNPAYRLNLFSAAAMAGAFAVFAALLGGNAWSSAAFLLAGAAPLFVRLSSVSEVFALNVLALAVVAAALWAGSGGEARAGPRRWFLTALLCGLALGNQQTFLLTTPALAWLFWREGGNAAVRGRLAAWGTAFLLAGLAVYLFLYLRSMREPLLDWEDPQTFERFRQVVLRARYGTWQLAQGEVPSLSARGVAAQARFFASQLWSAWGLAGCLALLAGLWSAVVRTRDDDERRRGGFFLLAALFAGPVFLVWANTTPTAATRDMLARFLPLSLAALTYFPARGVESLARAGGRWGRVSGVALLVVWSVSTVRGASAVGDTRWDTRTYDHGRNVFRCLPAGASLFADRADETEFAAAYLQDVAGARPDAEFVDANAGVSKSLYGDDYYRVWGKPRLARRSAVEKARIAAGARPVFYATLDTDQLDIPRRAAGLLYEARLDGRFSEKTRFPYDAVLCERGGAVADARERHLVVSHGRLMGGYAAALGDVSGARRYFAMAAREGAAAWELELAAWHQKGGRLDDAARLYERFLKREPGTPLVWNNLGVLHATRREWTSAFSCYDRALRLDPLYADALYNRGVARWEQGDWAAVVRDFEAVLAVNPAHPSAGRFLIEARRRAGAGNS